MSPNHVASATWFGRALFACLAFPGAVAACGFEISRPLVLVLVLVAFPAKIPCFLWAVFVFSILGGVDTVLSSGLSHAQAREFWVSQVVPIFKQRDIPGAVIGIVSSNQVLFEESFGFADLEREIPVSISSTYFRVASLTKIVTAAAVLQLADRGLIDLNQDIGVYLDPFFRPRHRDYAISVHHLLTHTAGFDVDRFFYAAKSVEKRLTLEEYVQKARPEAVRPPGVHCVYDNYGYALAGYLVQEIAKTPYSDYVESHILRPLGMDRCRFTLPDRITGDYALGYARAGDSIMPLQRSYVNITPSAGMLATCADMTSLMMGLLGSAGKFIQNPLEESIREAMLTTREKMHPLVPGRSYGFNKILVDGRSILRKTGKWPGFNAVMLLDPARQTGLFIAYNLDDRLRAARQIYRRFIKGLRPDDSGLSIPSATSSQASAQPQGDPAGEYLSLRHPQRSPWMGRPATAVISKTGVNEWEVNGYRYIRHGKSGLRVVEPVEVDNGFLGERLGWAYTEGTITHLITQSGTFRRMAWYETPAATSSILAGILFIMCFSFIYWVLIWVSKVFRRNISKDSSKGGAGANRLKNGAILVGMVNACLVVWFHAALTLALLRLPDYEPFYGPPAGINRLLFFPPILCLAALSVVMATVLMWSKKGFGMPTRFHFTLVSTASVLYCFGLNMRNYLSF